MIFPILIGIAAIVVSVILLKKEVNIGIVLLIDCVFIIAATRMPFDTILSSLKTGIFSKTTIGLLVIIVLIMIVENVMRNTGMIKMITDNIKELVGNTRKAAMLMPLFLGLLPSPGGARFSCPMVEEVLAENGKNTENTEMTENPEMEKAGATKNGTANDRAFLNYWFRHVWLDGFFLYPGALIAAGLLKISPLRFFISVIPFSLLHFLLGFIAIRKRIKPVKTISAIPKKQAWLGLLKGMAPILLIIVLYFSLIGIFEFALQLACLIAIIFLFIYKKYNLRGIWKAIRESFILKYFIMILGVMIFVEFLNGSGLVDRWVGLIVTYYIPREVLFIFLPFITGFLSGITVSYVSLSFPILMPLGMENNLWLGVFSFIAGYVGIMVTPLHLCAVMSADYFKTALHRVLRKVISLETVMMLLVIILIFIVF